MTTICKTTHQNYLSNWWCEKINYRQFSTVLSHLIYFPFQILELISKIPPSSSFLCNPDFPIPRPWIILLAFFTMISLNIVYEFCVINGNCSSITLDLLPSTSQPRRISASVFLLATGNMADMLHKAIKTMSIEEETPLTLPE